MQRNILKPAMQNSTPVPLQPIKLIPCLEISAIMKISRGISVSGHIPINEVITKEKIFAELRLSLLKQRF
jgi:hypothetical protein